MYRLVYLLCRRLYFEWMHDWYIRNGIAGAFYAYIFSIYISITFFFMFLEAKASIFHFHFAWGKISRRYQKLVEVEWAAELWTLSFIISISWSIITADNFGQNSKLEAEKRSNLAVGGKHTTIWLLSSPRSYTQTPTLSTRRHSRLIDTVLGET